MSLKTWWIVFAGGLGVLVLIAIGLAGMYGPAPRDVEEPSEAPAAATAEETAHIMAKVFFGTPDGQALVPLRRDVPLAASVVEQGRQILMAQLAEPGPTPYVSVIPDTTTLLAFYVTERGDAFVDLSPEIVNGHPGGSLNELLTVQAIVHAVTANLPAIKRVQVLVSGREVDTLAGHVDLRRPLSADPALVREDGK